MHTEPPGRENTWGFV